MGPTWSSRQRHRRVVLLGPRGVKRGAPGGRSAWRVQVATPGRHHFTVTLKCVGATLQAGGLTPRLSPGATKSPPGCPHAGEDSAPSRIRSLARSARRLLAGNLGGVLDFASRSNAGDEWSEIGGLFDMLERPAWHAAAACREHPDVSWFPVWVSGPRRPKPCAPAASASPTAGCGPSSKAPSYRGSGRG